VHKNASSHYAAGARADQRAKALRRAGAKNTLGARSLLPGAQRLS